MRLRGVLLKSKQEAWRKTKEEINGCNESRCEVSGCGIRGCRGEGCTEADDCLKGTAERKRRRLMPEEGSLKLHKL